MIIIDPVALEEMIPGGGFDVLPPIFVPVDVGFVAQDAGAFFAVCSTGLLGGATHTE